MPFKFLCPYQVLKQMPPLIHTGSLRRSCRAQTMSFWGSLGFNVTVAKWGFIRTICGFGRTKQYMANKSFSSQLLFYPKVVARARLPSGLPRGYGPLLGLQVCCCCFFEFLNQFNLWDFMLKPGIPHRNSRQKTFVRRLLQQYPETLPCASFLQFEQGSWAASSVGRWHFGAYTFAWCFCVPCPRAFAVSSSVCCSCAFRFTFGRGAPHAIPYGLDLVRRFDPKPNQLKFLVPVYQ